MVTSDKAAARGIHHVGLTVPDAEAAAAFFLRALDCQRMFDVDDTRLDDEASAASLDIGVGARIEKLIFLRLPHGPSLELFQYFEQGRSDVRPRNSDLGGHHVALLVKDIEQVARGVEREGGRLCGPINVARNSPFGGLKWIYFVTPWGLQMELVEPPPEGIDFETQTGRPVHEL